MKKTFFAFALLAATAVVSTTAHAQDMRKESEYLRTLFVPVGQQKIVLEAPDGTCFFDRSKGVDAKVMAENIVKWTELKHGTLLAIFAPCNDVANLPATPSSIGSITWLDQSVGDRTKSERADYLDLREPTYKDEQIAESDANIKWLAKEEAKEKDSIKSKINVDFEDTVERSDTGVRLGFVMSKDRGGDKTSSSGVVATTTIRHVPLEIQIDHNTTEKAHPIAEIHLEMEKFLAKQIALNE